MAYKRITKDIYEIRVQRPPQKGYECVCIEETLKGAHEKLREYQEKEPMSRSYIRKVRVKLNDPNNLGGKTR